MAKGPRLDDVLARVEARRTGDGFRARCPAHASDNPSTLSIREAPDGRVWLRCMAHDCSYEAILRALGLWKERIPVASSRSLRAPRPPQDHARQAREAAVRLIGDLLTGLPVTHDDDLERFGCYAALVEDVIDAERIGGPALAWAFLEDQFLVLLRTAPSFVRSLMSDLRRRANAPTSGTPQAPRWLNTIHVAEVPPCR